MKSFQSTFNIHDVGLRNFSSSRKIDEGDRIPKFKPSAVSFGYVYDNTQQFEHFSMEYHNVVLRHIPPLVSSQWKMTSRVDSVPTSIKRSAIIPPNPHQSTTLTRKLEPQSYNHHHKPTSRVKNNSLSVFSGPHYLPEKYCVKPLKAFRQKYFVPTYTDDTPTRYYATPDVNNYFQAALQDGSYFEAYSNYRPTDPVNFRHAYHVEHSLIGQEDEPWNPPQDIPVQIQKPKAVRRWHKPVTRSPTISEEEEDEEDLVVLKTMSNEMEDIQEDEDDSDDFMNPTSPPLPRPTTSQPTQSKKRMIESPSLKIKRDKGKGKATEIVIPAEKKIQKFPTLKLTIRKPPSPSPPPSFAQVKKRKLNSLIPSKTEAKEELRQLGKFIKIWKQKDAEVCCICYQDVTTESNPLVYCDNALCEVIVHKSCYNIKTHIAEDQQWYCDKCRLEKGVSPYRNVTCALCPSTTGAFCKLAEPIHGIRWVHMICATFLSNPNGFIHQPKTHNYKLSIKESIPVQYFTSVCSYCQDPMFAQFGAKLKCQFCPQSFHVTCAEKNGYWCFHKNAVLACSVHGTQSTTKASPKRLSLVFEKWLQKRDAHYLVSFEKTPYMFKIDAWKKKSKINVFVQDDIDKCYKLFFDRIEALNEDAQKKQYARYVENLLSEFCRAYSSTTLLDVNGLFFKKNFYHGEEYGYVAGKNAFLMCEDDEETDTEDESEEEIPKKKRRFSMSPATPEVDTPKKPNTPPERCGVVIPSDDLVCSICQQHEIPKTTWDSFHLSDNYLETLEQTSHLRKVGHTGTANYWDPRVFIECSECKARVHCGCPSPPIKKYPQKFQSFVCIHCDTKGEENHPFHKDDVRRRGTIGINYKV